MIDKDIRERIINGFAINRIQPDKKKWFIEFSKDNFFDDRGMALSHLIDVYTGIISSGTEHLEIAISELRTEVNDLKEQLKKKEEEPKEIKSLDGKRRLR